MLIGEYRSKLGERKRISIPVQIRKKLGKQLIITRGYENSLVIVNKKMWERITKDIVDGSFIDKNTRDISRFLVGSASELTCDAQGRFVIPKALYEYSELGKKGEEVVFVGLVNWVEVWSKEKWEERIKYVSKNADKISKELTDATK